MKGIRNITRTKSLTVSELQKFSHMNLVISYEAVSIILYTQLDKTEGIT